MYNRDNIKRVQIIYTFEVILKVIFILSYCSFDLRFVYDLNCSFKDNGRIKAVQLVIYISINKQLNHFGLSQNLLQFGASVLPFCGLSLFCYYSWLFTPLEYNTALVGKKYNWLLLTFTIRIYDAIKICHKATNWEGKYLDVNNFRRNARFTGMAERLKRKMQNICLIDSLWKTRLNCSGVTRSPLTMTSI